MASAVVGALRVVLSLDSAEFDTAMKRVSSSAKDWGNDLTNIGRQATAVGSALTKTLTLPLVGLGLAAVKSASDFESSFAGVRKTVEATEPEFAALAQGLRDMAKEIPVSVNELNKVAEAAGQLGIKKDDIIAFTRTMADLGVTTNLTADEAATATAQIQNIFGAAGKDVDRFGATLVALGNAGASTEKDIVEMGKRIAGAGHQVGLTQAQVLAFASALSSVGINAEAGGSAISRVFLKINDAVAKGGSGMTEFARVSGMTAAEFKQAWEKDAATATTAFITGLGRLKAEGENVNATIEGLVGKNIILKDTLMRASGAGTLLTEQLALGNKAWQENTALTTEAEKRYGTFESQVITLRNQLQDVAITFGNALLPMLKAANNAIKDLVPILDRMAKGFAGLPLPVQAIAVGFAALVAAAGPAIWIFGQLTLAAGTVIKAFTSKGIAMRAITTVMESTGMSAAGLGKHVGLLSGVFGTLTGAIGVVARVLTGPVGIALTAVDVSIRALTGNSHSLFSIVSDMATVLGDALTRGLKSAWEWTKSALEVTEKWAGAVGEFVSGAASEFGQLLYDWVPAIRAVVDGFTLWGQKLGLITKEGAAFWAEQAEHVRTTREVEKWVDKTSESLTEQARKAKESALSNDLLAGANRVLADEYKRVEAESKKTAVAVALSEAQLKAAKAAADAFAKSLSALGGRDALAGAEEVVKQLGALGGPLNVLPGKLDEMAGRLREAAQAALMMGKTGLAEQYMKLAATLSPIIQFQQRFNVTIGEYVTDANTATDATNALWDQFNRLSGQAIKIGPLLKSTWVLPLTQFKDTVKEVGPEAVRSFDAIGEAVRNMGNTILQAVQGGGSVLQSIGSSMGMAIGKDLSENLSGFLRRNLGKTLGDAFGAVMPGIGALLGPALEKIGSGLKSLFGIGINEEVKKANVEIEKLRGELLKTHGTMDNLEEASNRVGLSFQENWGHQGQAGLKAMTALMAEFERRTKAVAAASAQAVAGFAAVADSMTKPWVDLGKAIDVAFKNTDDANAAFDRAKASGKSGAEELLKLREAFLEAENAEQSLYRTQWQMRETGKQQLADLGTQAVATFGAVLIATGSYSEAIKQVGPSLKSLGDSYKALGLDVEDVGLKHLILQSTVAEANPQLIAAVSGLGQSMQGLAQLGLLNVDTFGAMQRTGLAMYARLQGEVVKVGGTTRDALLPMQGYLQQAAAQAELLGIPLDANTKMLIDQSKELGIWKEKGKSANDLLIEGMQKLVDTVGTLLSHMLGVSGAITGLPARKEVQVVVNTDYNDTHYVRTVDLADAGDPGHATGTFGRYGSWFKDFGAQTQTALHGVEAVITPQQAPAFAMEVLGGMMPASSGGGDMSALLSEIQGLRRELNTTIPAIAESAARHGSQTSGRRR